MSAARGEGVAELLEAVAAHREHLDRSGEGERRAEERLKDEAADLVAEWAREQARRLLDSDAELEARLLRERIPYAAAEELLTRSAPLVPREARRQEG
jgi:LAO/AO transport system kinase